MSGFLGLLLMSSEVLRRTVIESGVFLFIEMAVVASSKRLGRSGDASGELRCRLTSHEAMVL